MTNFSVCSRRLTLRSGPGSLCRHISIVVPRVARSLDNASTDRTWIASIGLPRPLDDAVQPPFEDTRFSMTTHDALPPVLNYAWSATYAKEGVESHLSRRNL